MTPKGKINNASEGASGVRVGEKEKGKARSRNLLYRRKSGNLRLKMVFNNNKKIIIYTGTQKTSKSQSNLENEKWSWRNQAA